MHDITSHDLSVFTSYDRDLFCVAVTTIKCIIYDMMYCITGLF